MVIRTLLLLVLLHTSDYLLLQTTLLCHRYIINPPPPHQVHLHHFPKKLFRRARPKVRQHIQCYNRTAVQVNQLTSCQMDDQNLVCHLTQDHVCPKLHRTTRCIKLLNFHNIETSEFQQTQLTLKQNHTDHHQSADQLQAVHLHTPQAWA